MKERHGMRYTRFYRIWSGMKYRCATPTSKDYPKYGGRGIIVDESWSKFSGFFNDMYDAYKSHSEIHGEENTTLDRIDNRLGYSKDNCRWATRAIQNNNKSYGHHLLLRNASGRFTGSIVKGI